MPALLQAFLRLVALKRLGVLLFVLAATLCATNTASAFAPAQTKTRIGVFDLASDNSSGLLSVATGGKHQGIRSALSEVASGSLLAAEGAEVAAGAAEREATGFLGKSGYELQNLQAVRNTATTIEGRTFSGHALDQMQNRGIMPSVVQNTIEHGTTFGTRAGTTGFFDAVNNIRVILNSESGTVVTVIRGAP